MPYQFITNVRLFDSQKNAYDLVTAVIRGGLIERVTTDPLPRDSAGRRVIDGKGAYLFASLCDIHTHGALLCDFTSAGAEEICAAMRHYAAQGVTSVFPTTVTAEKDVILRALGQIAIAANTARDISIDGIHMEGPFLAPKRKGAHTRELLRLPDIAFIDRAIEQANGLKLRVTVAPELENALDFIRMCVGRGLQVSIGHTDADYDTVMKAIDAGADSFTHLYNAMSPLLHREPGAVGAALLSDKTYAELICDGKHIRPETVRITSKIKDREKIVLVTDSLQAAGMGGGEVTEIMSGATRVIIADGEARTLDGVLAGSILGLFDGVVNYMNFSGVPLHEAHAAASLNPRRLMKLDKTAGSIAPGKSADLILCSQDTLYLTLLRGQITYRAESFKVPESYVAPAKN